MKISARSSAQLELRLHWFTRALAIRGGYIVATARRSSGAGRHMAAVAYELPLPKFPRPSRAPEYSRSSEYSRGPDARSPERRLDAAQRIAGEWSVRQEQDSSSGAV